MKTTILSTRRLLNPFARQRIPMFIKDLSKEVTKQDGFLKGRSFWSKDRSVLFTITEWEQKNDWDKWYKSDVRNMVLKDLPTHIIKSEHEIIDEHIVRF